MAKYFTREEFVCQYTGTNKIKDEFIEKLDELREACGFPFIITSGYRSPSHPIEAKKKNCGTTFTRSCGRYQSRGWHTKVSIGPEGYRIGFFRNWS